ncbi:MAG: phosphotransferase [Deltaproteobacteria bacterium]|nr:phosphotransferase [Deltaproteobacteria bacterium]
MIDEQLIHIIKRKTGAHSLALGERIQTLWSGYGQIFRATLYGISAGNDALPVVIKHVRWPTPKSHPAGWTSDLSHQRKVRSYDVECAFYTTYASRLRTECRVPQLMAIENHDDELLIILEDLDAAGFSVRKYRLSLKEIDVTLRWLAQFHATFLGAPPNGLWPVGTYWHLDTRPDELRSMSDEPLRQAAAKIDGILSDATHQTLVHGDAKVANFCYARRGSGVAAVDFQYVGGGCGMKDVAYFVGSCLGEDECERLEYDLLQRYFGYLKAAIVTLGGDVDARAVEAEWRDLYHVAWVDFHRFIKGWTVENWHTADYSERLKRQVLDNIQKGSV